MDIIKQVLSSLDVEALIIGLLFIVIGIVVGVFKQYWLIAGVNTAPKKELEKIDLNYVGKYFGIFCGGLGVILIVGQFVFLYFNIRGYMTIFFPIMILLFVVFLFTYGHLKKDRIYKKK